MPHYPPLHMPEAPRGPFARLRESISLGPSEAEHHLLNQMRVRDPIPHEVWGGDPVRVAFGQEIAAIIGERIGWPNCHFIPEDPFEWVVYVIGGEDLEHTELAMALEATLGLPIDDVEWEMFMQWTVGEVVDYFRSDRKINQPNVLDSRPLPLSGPQQLEAKHCPRLAAFIDIRRLLSRNQSSHSTVRITPSTNVRDLNERTRRYLDWYLDSRFGIGVSPIRPYSPLRTALMSTSSTTAASLVMGSFGGVLALFSGTSPVETFWTLGCFAGIAAVVGVFIISLESLLVLSTRDYWRARSISYQRVQTLGELVDWVVTRRAELRTQT
jgi:hypothetical protein